MVEVSPGGVLWKYPFILLIIKGIAVIFDSLNRS